MKKFQRHFSRAALFVSIVFWGAQLTAEIRFTNNDPFPLYTAANPLAPFTYWQDCKPEQRVSFSASFYRQNANAGRSGPFTEGICPTNACSGCQQCCNKDVPIGDIHGRWDMIALFYPESNGNTDVATNLVKALELCVPGANGVKEQADVNAALTYILNPANFDPNEEFGFFSVPITYRKYGLRFEADITTCWDIGVRVQGGVATIRQNAIFLDKTCSATGDLCTTGTTGTPCILNQASCDAINLVVNGIMKKQDIVADVLGLDIEDFCETDLEDVTLGLYWSHCYYRNKGTDNPCWPELTIAPYIIAEVAAPISKDQNTNKLLSVPFGLNKHWGYGVSGGFNVNFVDTVQIGFEAGFMHYSREFYGAYPVMTNEHQIGMLPRKADVRIKPGSTWSFGATLACSYFLSCLSCYTQFRLIHHCNDSICVVRTLPVTPVTSGGTASCLENPSLFQPAAPGPAIDIAEMEERSAWDSSFVDVSFDYDITKDVSLGFLWQAPVSQQFAYRPTTVMGSIIIRY